MILDLRIPLGLMFTLVGLILTLFGLKTNGDAALYARCLGINANLWWGMVLLAFGLIMLLLGRRGQKRLEEEPPQPSKKGSQRRGH
jgi:membrane protein implicated in regulation of membrane protease activity